MPVRVVQMSGACGHHHPGACSEGIAIDFEICAKLSDGIGRHAKTEGLDED